MAFFTMRFDLRNPAFAQVPLADRYDAALDMCAFAERNGFVALILSEHHGSDDGYLPSALTFAAAVAARTTTLRLVIAAVVASLHDPLHLAEQAAVVDQLSRGRLSLVVANGYAPHEFAMFDQPLGQRVARVKELVATLRSAATGEPFEFRGRQVHVTPRPYKPRGPKLVLGGSSDAAGRRAAELELGFMPTTGEPWEAYRSAVIEAGRSDPGPFLGGTTGFVHLAEDVESGWEDIAPYALHESNAYGAWVAAAGLQASGVYRPFTSVEELRAAGMYEVVTPAALVERLQAAGPFATVGLHPMMGGIPPEVAWKSLRLLESDVLPQLCA
jgi:alkanesulfonate monooxygenase SsuD/methylene tetrahydromethanopterin reductase-like flavin-dependent oxidoreductase (luciferase family)